MLSMTMATLGWGTWWLAVVLWELAPAWAPSLEVTLGVACAFAVVGCGFWLFSLRAKLAWVLITVVPLFANASLLVLPLFLEDLRAAAATLSGRE
jgi:hypothetical protein